MRRLLKILSNLLILVAIIYFSVIFYPIYSAEARYYWKQATGNKQQNSLNLEDDWSDVLGETTLRNLPEPETPFSSLLKEGPPLGIEPVNRESAILIPKIDVNTPIVWDVSVSDENAYLAALNSGVAHAKGTAHPSSQAGNTYLFAHSTTNPIDIRRYSAVFTLLHQLETDDRIVIFYQGKRYDYLVEKEEVVPSFDTTPLLRSFDQPMLTLQTCDPPGIPKDRRIITARLVGIYEK